MDETIISKALSQSSHSDQLSFLDLAKLDDYTEDQIKWAKIFWEASFNTGWMYVSKEMLIEWFGYKKTKSINNKFYNKLKIILKKMLIIN